MAQYIVVTGVRCDIVLLYCCSRADEFLFADTFEQASRAGLRTVSVLTDHQAVPPNWAGRAGGITADTIGTEILDYQKRTFFLSGSHGMVNCMEAVLRGLSIRRSRIRKDYFDGAVDRQGDAAH